MSKNKKKNSNNHTSIHELDFSQEQIKELREAFAIFDKDGDGFITSSELQDVMKSLREKFTKEDIHSMIQQVDVDGNGTIDFDEFLRMMSRSSARRNKSADVQSKSEEDEMRQAFKVFDIDGNGLIDAQELLQTMKNLGEDLTENDVKAMIKAADKNGDEKIDYEEFIRMMYQK